MTTYDLIILLDDRLVFHGPYPSPQDRLEALIRQLTFVDTFACIDGTGVLEIALLASPSSPSKNTVGETDRTFNQIAKLSRRYGVRVYASTTEKPVTMEPPAVIYSVFTEYSSEHTTVEHFTSPETRLESLQRRAHSAFDEDDSIPEIVLNDENRLANLIDAFIMPARTKLTEATWDNEDRYSSASHGHDTPMA